MILEPETPGKIAVAFSPLTYVFFSAIACVVAIAAAILYAKTVSGVCKNDYDHNNQTP